MSETQSGMYALSVKQPWATLLILGIKSIEIRRWTSGIRGPVLIHAAKVADPRPEGWSWITDETRSMTELRGGIIGLGEVTECIKYDDLNTFVDHRSRHLNDPGWFHAPMYGFQFVNVHAVPMHSCKGQVRFFHVDSGVRPELVTPPELES